MKTIKKAKHYADLCEAIADVQCDVQPDHVPNPAFPRDGGASCIECGGFIPDENEATK